MSIIPGWNRSSDVRNLVLTDACNMNTVLNWLYPDEVQGTVWWVLGSALHKGIELTILEDLTHQLGLDACRLEMQILLHANRKVDTLESSSKRRKRSLYTIEEDLERLYLNWWNGVHPSSKDRNHLYDDYSWPPVVEYMVRVPEAPGAALYTEIDAIFVDGPSDRPVAIVDWKSGSSKTAAEAQLHIYRYGLHHEGGWFPEGAGPMVGWFDHLEHNKRQIVDPYVGDTTVAHWLTMTRAYKEAMIETNSIVATNSYLCKNYNNAKGLCPVCSDDPNTVKPWAEILGRLERATLLEAPAYIETREE